MVLYSYSYKTKKFNSYGWNNKKALYAAVVCRKITISIT